MFGTYYPHGNVTFRNVIGAEPLHDSIHPKGEHGFGPLFSNDEGGRVTFTGSLLSHFACRAPLAESTEFVMVNNLIYDRIYFATQLRNQFGNPSKMTLEGNRYIDGPSILTPGFEWARNRAPILIENDPSRYDFQSESQVYLHDNAWTDYLGETREIEWSMVQTLNDPQVKFEDIAVDTRPVWNEGLEALPSSEVEDYVLQNAGAWPAFRLPYEEKIINNVRNRTGGMVNSVAEAGGWPEVEHNTRTLIVPKNPHGDDDGDGYTNIEEWLHAYAAYVEGRGAEPELIAPEEGEPIDEEPEEPEPVGEPVITDLVIYDTGAPHNNDEVWQIKRNLQEDDFIYGDRQFTFWHVPEIVAGCTWLSPANNSKTFNDSPLVTFKLTNDSFVYVGIDDRIEEHEMPDWISEWTDTGEVLISDPGSNNITYKLYNKSYPANSTVSLGGNGTSTISCQYIVIVSVREESFPGNALAEITDPANGSVLITLPTRISGTAVDTDSANEDISDIKVAILQKATNKYYNPSTKWEHSFFSMLIK